MKVQACSYNFSVEYVYTFYFCAILKNHASKKSEKRDTSTVPNAIQTMLSEYTP